MVSLIDFLQDSIDRRKNPYPIPPFKEQADKILERIADDAA
jgi:hypothetical protein